MAHESRDRLQIRNIPWTLWATCGLFMVVGVLGFIYTQWQFLFVTAGGLLLIVLLTTVTVLTADRGRGTVTLTSWTPLHGAQRREIALGDITKVEIEHTGGSEGPVGRAVLALASGEHVPVTDYYSLKAGQKLPSAQRLSDFLAVGREAAVIDDVADGRQQTGSTAGIDWRCETLLGADGTPITRWQAAAGGCADGLLVLYQVNPGLGRLPWHNELFGQLAKFGVKAILTEYQFDAVDVEAAGKALPLPDLDPCLQGRYLAFTAGGGGAPGWLSPARSQALADWATAHPTPAVRPDNTVALGAGLLLAAPTGLWLVFVGATDDPACVAEIAGLGAALATATAVTA